MRLPAPFRAAGDHIAIDLDGACALFTTRGGGVSRGPYESLNLGRWTDDDPAAVKANRERVATLAGLSEENLAQGRQVHGTHVRRLPAAPARGEEAALADGQATVADRVAPIVLVADCLPVALAGDGGVAMLHAGWRGLAGGVLEEGVRALRGLGVSGALSAAIGPGAGGCCYEVGEEVRAAFAEDGDAIDGRRLDLKRVARRRLEAAGVETVHDAGLCTLCTDESLFFSHRRDGGVTGRQAGLAWRVS